MDQLAEMRVFVRAIELGAFAGAARELGLSPSAVSKLISRLEARLGSRLINRTTRQLSLTPEGETYFETGRRLVEEIDLLEDQVGAKSGRPRGMLRVNAGYGFGMQQLTPALADFTARYPDVTIHLSLSDKMIDLHAERVDVAIRSTAAQSDSSLMAKKIAETSRVICASPAYIEKYGLPLAPVDLARHRIIIFSEPIRGHRWPFYAANGEIEHVEVTGPVITDNTECAIRLALAGVALIRINEMFVADALRDGRLVSVLANRHAADRLTTWAVFPAGAQRIPRVRVFLDFLAERFASIG